MKVTLTRVTGDPVLAIEEAAANCYNSEPSENGKIMRGCIQSGHTSVAEFCDFTFHVEGVSRALLAQLTRHRMASYAVRSQRYCKEDGFGYYTPPKIAVNEELKAEYDEMMNTIAQFYEHLLDCGCAAEDARMVLPNACFTTLEVKMNLRALMNFMNERLCSRAQNEIRTLASEMRRCIVNQYPDFAPYLVPKCEKYPDHPFCPERNSCGRHPRLEEVYTI